ncbi:hypothetical protein V8D89_008274 [Ganoderma adspersum]
MTSTTIPTTMKAVVIEPEHKVAVKDRPVPSIGDDDILVKTVSVALNPTDWKHVDMIGDPGTILGVDFSGIVSKVGKNVSSPKVGDHVAGFVHGGCFEDEGAFAEYVKTPADLVWSVPPKTFSHDEAASLNCAFFTAVQDLYHPTRLSLVEPPAKVAGEDWILVYGGSSAVGQYVIQLAHASGYKVVTTASPRNFDLVKAFGADAVFDYRDPEVVSKIKEVTGDSLTKGVDAIGELSSQRICAESLGPKGGRVVLVSDVKEGATQRTDVVLQPSLLYTALGREFEWRGVMVIPRFEEDLKHHVEALKKVPQLILDGVVKPLPIKLWEGGLEAIADGLQWMREGKVSGQKIVYRI